MSGAVFGRFLVTEGALANAALPRLGNDRWCVSRREVLGGRPGRESRGLRSSASLSR